MSYGINIQSKPPYKTSAVHVRKAAQATLDHEEAPIGSLSILLTDEQTLQAANKRFAGIDEPTDVLAFIDGEPMPDAEGVYFGDVLIAVPLAERQALLREHTLREELCLLTVHGILHLLGYDHGQEIDQELMWTRQSAILARLDIDQSVMEITY